MVNSPRQVDSALEEGISQEASRVHFSVTPTVRPSHTWKKRTVSGNTSITPRNYEMHIPSPPLCKSRDQGIVLPENSANARARRLSLCEDSKLMRKRTNNSNHNRAALRENDAFLHVNKNIASPFATNSTTNSSEADPSSSKSPLQLRRPTLVNSFSNSMPTLPNETWSTDLETRSGSSDSSTSSNRASTNASTPNSSYSGGWTSHRSTLDDSTPNTPMRSSLQDSSFSRTSTLDDGIPGNDSIPNTPRLVKLGESNPNMHLRSTPSNRNTSSSGSDNSHLPSPGSSSQPTVPEDVFVQQCILRKRPHLAGIGASSTFSGLSPRSREVLLYPSVTLAEAEWGPKKRGFIGKSCRSVHSESFDAASEDLRKYMMNMLVDNAIEKYEGGSAPPTAGKRHEDARVYEDSSRDGSQVSSPLLPSIKCDIVPRFGSDKIRDGSTGRVTGRSSSPAAHLGKNNPELGCLPRLFTVSRLERGDGSPSMRSHSLPGHRVQRSIDVDACYKDLNGTVLRSPIS